MLDKRFVNEVKELVKRYTGEFFTNYRFYGEIEMTCDWYIGCHHVAVLKVKVGRKGPCGKELGYLYIPYDFMDHDIRWNEFDYFELLEA